MLLGYGANTLICNKRGETPLFDACDYGYLKIVKELFKYNTDSINICNRGGQSPLYVSVLSKRYEIIELLLRNDADVKIRTKGGRSILHLASSPKFYNPSVIRKFLRIYDFD